MPRGRAYSQRVDLAGPKTQKQPGQKIAIKAASDQAYGVAGAQLAAQKALPIAAQPGPAATLGAGGDQGQGRIAPAPVTVPLDSPTTHGLPITHGMDTIQPSLDTNITIKALGLLNSLGDEISPQVAMIKSYLQAQAGNGFTR